MTKTLQQSCTDKKNHILHFPMNNLPRRMFLNSIQIFGFIATILLISAIVESDIFPVEGAIYAIVFLLLLIIIYKSYDCYIIDFSKKQLNARRKFLWWSYIKFIANFADIAGIGIDGELHTGKGLKWWEYFAVIILKNGKMYRVSDYQTSFLTENINDDVFFQNSNEFAQQLAEILQVPLFEGKKQHRLVVKYQKGELAVTHKPVKMRLMQIYLIGFLLILITIIFQFLWK